MVGGFRVKSSGIQDEVRAPSSFDVLYEQYFDYVQSLLYKYGVPRHRIEDDTQDIFVAFLKNDIIGQFDETMVVTHDGKQFRTRFKQFLTVKVERYARGKRDKAIRTQRRELLVSEMTPPQLAESEAQHSWATVCRPLTEDDLSRPEVEEMVALIRAHLVNQPVCGMRDLTKLFDMVVGQLNGGCDLPDRKKIMREWIGVQVPGVAQVVTVDDLVGAVMVLRRSPGAKIRPYLEDIGSPLATATDYQDYPDENGFKKQGYIDHLVSVLVSLGGEMVDGEIEPPKPVSSTTVGMMFTELREATREVVGAGVE